MNTTSPVRLRLGRAQRIQRSGDFARLRQHGQRISLGCLVANWKDVPPGAPARVGVITSRKIGNAVARARARRLLRESFCRHQHDLAHPVDLVLVARNSIAGKSCGEVEKDLLSALKRARLLRAAPTGETAAP